MSEANDTPLRRSKRGQPVVAYISSPPSSSALDIVPGPLLYSRPSKSTDLFEDEAKDVDSVQSWNTYFYHSYKRGSNAPPSRAPVRTYGRVSRPRKSDTNTTAEFKVGDTVLVRTASTLPSVAVIIAVWKIEGEQYRAKAPLHVRVHWFVRPSELPKIRARRAFYENEVLYNIAACETLPPSAILAHCHVSPDPAKAIASPEDATPDVLYCRQAVDPMRGLYYDLKWDSFRLRALSQTPEQGADAGEWPNDDIWTVKSAAVIKSRTIGRESGRDSPRKRRRIAHDEDELSEFSDDASGDEFEAPLNDDSDVDEDVDNNEEDDVVAELEPRTPSRRKRKRAGTSTPRTPRTPRRTASATTTTATPRRGRPPKDASLAHPTPHSKAALRKRKKTALAVRPPDVLDAMLDEGTTAGLGADPWLRAMHVLHVAARPGALPCREAEYGRVLRAVEELLEEGSGGCIYISGVPGTGKTATVHAVVRELKRMAEQNEANPFAFVEINGLKIPEPAAAYGLLWEAVSGHDAARDGHMKISAKEALRLLSNHFSGAARVGPAGGHACVVLMDELDQLMTSKQDVVYNFFNWPTLAGSKLVVLAVANTMDLPERVMSRARAQPPRHGPHQLPAVHDAAARADRESASGQREAGLPADTPDVIAPTRSSSPR
ncbi:hypothetical protein BN946_scf184939.g13 [Trametes cinnabarina]|uniref:Origin recognition complex subunit 1 n=1 Tax=Pycnoporus cinnabarinus TaxID=5643 RepID=A0A060SHX9_PYCCI|nr:hypothetical protein BN946_scf184939.g13 [Trametes cinnabarina]